MLGVYEKMYILSIELCLRSAPYKFVAFLLLIQPAKKKKNDEKLIKKIK